MHRTLSLTGLAMLLTLPLRPTTRSPLPPLSLPPSRLLPRRRRHVLKIKKDFKVELLYSVPKDEQGSWVSMCVDPKGRLIVSDQYGRLYRITPPPLGGNRRPKPRSRSSTCRSARPTGLLWAFDSLYVVVNEGVKFNGVAVPRGLYRVRSKDGGDTFDKPEFLQRSHGGGEHGPHAVLPGPDGKSLYIVVGDAHQDGRAAGRLARAANSGAKTTCCRACPTATASWPACSGRAAASTRSIPTARTGSWSAPATATSTTSPSTAHGDLFTYDADMEWDMNTPWYRPTRVCLAASGSEFGWRNGTGKWPPYYPDSLPASRQRRPRLADRHDLRLRRQVSRPSTRTPSSSATGATASSTPCI